MEKIIEGAVVFLKSDHSSTRMTVGKIEGDTATCYWLDMNGQQQSGKWPLSVLTLENPKPARVHVGWQRG